MGTGGDGDLHVAREGRYLNLSAEDGCRHVKQEVIDQVTLLTNEVLVFFLFDENEQVTGNTAARGCVTLAGDGQLHAAGYTCRDSDGDDLLIADDALAAAFRTLVLDDRALTATGVTLRLNLHHAEDTSLLADDASGTLTGRTGLRAAVGRTGAVAVLTLYELADLDLLLASGSYLLEGQMDLDTHVAASADTRSAAASSAASEEVTEVETCALEDITEMAEDIFHGHAASAESACATHTGEAVLVVTGTFLRVGQHLVCLRCLLEFLLGFFVAGVLVRVVLDGFLAVRLLYLLCCRGLGDLEHFIIITFFCHSCVMCKV